MLYCHSEHHLFQSQHQYASNLGYVFGLPGSDDGSLREQSIEIAEATIVIGLEDKIDIIITPATRLLDDKIDLGLITKHLKQLMR